VNSSNKLTFHSTVLFINQLQKKNSFPLKMITLCFSKAYHPGKLTFSCLRHCSSISTSLKTEAGGSTVLKESSSRYSPSVSLDIPPVLFIAKYNRLLETSDFAKTAPPYQPKEETSQQASQQQQEQEQQAENKKEDRHEENNWSPESLTQRKIRCEIYYHFLHKIM
jgi:hypothetical protein